LAFGNLAFGNLEFGNLEVGKTTFHRLLCSVVVCLFACSN
jgi:hypothetical protein